MLLLLDDSVFGGFQKNKNMVYYAKRNREFELAPGSGWLLSLDMVSDVAGERWVGMLAPLLERGEDFALYLWVDSETLVVFKRDAESVRKFEAERYVLRS